MRAGIRCSVRVAATYLSCMTMSAATLFAAMAPDVAMNARGDAVALFCDIRGFGNNYLYAANRRDGVWSEPVLIAREEGTYISPIYSQVGIDAAGNAMALFLLNDSVAGYIPYACRWDGSAWSSAAPVSGDLTGEIYDLDFAMGANGEAVVAFILYREGEFDRVYANRWNDAVWTGPVTIDNGLNRWRAVPVAAAGDGGGAAVLFWESDDLGGSRLCGTVWNGSGWTPPEALDAGGEYDFAHDIAMRGDGTATAIFCDNDGVDERLYASEWNGEAWSARTTLYSARGSKESDDDGIYWSELSARRAAGRVAVFGSWDGAHSTLYSNFWNSGAWSSAGAIDAADATGVAVAMTDDEHAILLIAQHERLYALHRDGGGWGAPVVLSASETGRCPYAALDSDGRGNAIALFVEYDDLCQEHGRVYAESWNGAEWLGPYPLDPVYTPEPPTPTPTPTPAPPPAPAPPIDLRLNKNIYATNDRIVVTADIQTIDIPFHPFIQVWKQQPDGSYRFLLGYSGNGGFTESASTFYLKGGPHTVASPIANYPVLDFNFNGVEPGMYQIRVSAALAVGRVMPIYTVDTEGAAVR